MGIENLGSNKWRVRVRTFVAGRIVGKKKLVEGTKIEARALEMALIKELEAIKKAMPSPLRSLKLCTFGDVLKFWSARTNAKLKTFQHLIERLQLELGNTRNEEIKERFGDFMDTLKTQRAREWIGVKASLRNQERLKAGKPAITRSLGEKLRSSTRNRYLDLSNRAYNFAVKRGKLKENPLEAYEKEKETGRDRVWTDAERKAIFEALEKRKSHLYWPVYFSSMNPIRRGDLVALTRENLTINQFNPSASFVHFLPQKTGRYKPREAHLICLDKRLLDYFAGLPKGCPLLFPRFDIDGIAHSLGCFKREWHAALKDAGVNGLTWHDLKHCAISWMLDNGFSELDLKNLGIQYSAEMIARYYHKDPSKARGAWEKIQAKAGLVAPACGPSLSKTA